jgi:hypothetical protein
MKKSLLRKKINEAWTDSIQAFGRGVADKATGGTEGDLGGYGYARAGADYLVKSGLKKLGLRGGEDTTFDREVEQEKQKLTKDAKNEPLASGAGDTVGYVVAASPIGSALKAVKAAVTTGKDYFNKAEPVMKKFEAGGVNLREDENTDKVSDIANQFKAMASEPVTKVGQVKKLPDINAPGVPDMFKVKKKLDEEGEGAPANSAGGGNIAGIGIPNPAKGTNFGEPGFSPAAMKKHKRRARKGQNNTEQDLDMLRRGQPALIGGKLTEAKMGKFAGNDTFIVPSDKFHSARNEKKKGKHWKNYIGEDEHGMHIREYANKNSKKPIILQDENTGAMCYARYGKK